MGIRERAEILGGTARVESSPGKGAHVEVRIPVPREQAAEADAGGGAA
jgi:signal transduction histidine kinase